MMLKVGERKTFADNLLKRSGSYIAEYNSRNYLFTVVEDGLVDKVISAIADAAGTGSVGDGKIFVTKIDDAVDIGSKQKGIHAI